NEDERDTARLVSQANKGIELSAAILAKYTGIYEYSGGSATVSGFMGRRQSVTLVNGRLYLNALPLIPQSETRFEATGADAEFVIDANGDANGKVSHLVLSQTEGDARYDRKP